MLKVKNMLPLNKKAFTLIELLVVIGILTVLLSIVLIAINPARQFSQANDTQRRSDVNTLLNAIHQYAADHKGTLPSGITSSEQVISSTEANLCADLVPTYVAQMPVDPTSGVGTTSCSASYDTGYTVIKNGSNRVTITAPDAEIEDISVTR